MVGKFSTLIGSCQFPTCEVVVWCGDLAVSDTVKTLAPSQSLSKHLLQTTTSQDNDKEVDNDATEMNKEVDNDM